MSALKAHLVYTFIILCPLSVYTLSAYTECTINALVTHCMHTVHTVPTEAHTRAQAHLMNTAMLQEKAPNRCTWAFAGRTGH